MIKRALILPILLLIILPVGNALAQVTLDSGVEYVGRSGGVITFAFDSACTEIYYPDSGLIHFKGLTYGSATWNEIGFDLSDGDTLTLMDLKSKVIAFEVYDGSGDGYATTKIYVGAMGMPKVVYVNSAPLTHPEGSLSAFNAADYNTWYYDPDTRILYIKTSGSTVKVEWLKPPAVAPIPPAPTPSPPAPPTPPEMPEWWSQTAFGLPLWCWMAIMLFLVLTLIILLRR